ncbi:MAG: hypothetical protein LBG82_07735 [Clostridiales Family XIII bacterium]|nr:hypothetical protein [Clostridiales Family XIII bacterium]
MPESGRVGHTAPSRVRRRSEAARVRRFSPFRTRRRGSAMVESAIYFPIMVLCVMFVIYVMIDMYSIASLQSHLHMAVRAESGRLSGVTDINADGGTGYDRYRAASFAKKVRLGAGNSGGVGTAEGSVSAKYGAGRMVRKVKVGMSSRAYAIKETGGIREALRK